MPILYKNKPHIMKTLQELTQQDAIDWIDIKNIDPLNGYTNIQANRLVELVKDYIDPKQRSCAHCGSTGALKEAKDKFVQFYIDNKNLLEDIKAGTQVIEIEPVIEEIEEIEEVEKPLRKISIIKHKKSRKK